MRIRRSAAVAVAAALLVALVATMPGSAMAAGSWLVTPVTNNAINDTWANVGGDRVAWLGGDGPGGAGGAGWDVFTWKAGDAGPTLVAHGASNNGTPMVSGDRLAWQGWDGTDYEVYTWKAGDAGPTQVTDNSYEDGIPVVDGDRLAWESYTGSTREVLTWKVGEAAPTLLASGTGTIYPAVSGDRVAWLAGGGIWTWAAGDATPIRVPQPAGSPIPDWRPELDGDRLVWSGWDGGDEEILTWKVGDAAPTQVTDNTYQDSWSYGVSGDLIAWNAQPDGTHNDVCVWTAGDPAPTVLTHGTAGATFRDISAGRIVGLAGVYGNEVFTWKAGDAAPTSLGRVGQQPRVSGDRVVWWSYGSAGSAGGYEVFTAVPSVPVVTVAPPSVAFGDVLVGTSVSAPVTLTNTGNAALEVTCSIEPATPGLTCDTTHVTIAPGSSADVGLTFAPAAAGPLGAGTALTLETNAPAGPSVSVPLSGTGTAPGITVAPPSVSFGDVELSKSTFALVTLTNTGSAALEVTCSLTAAAQGVTCDTAHVTIGAGSSADVKLTFAPTALGPLGATAAMTLETNVAGSPSVSVPLSGNGVKAELPAGQMAQELLAFYNGSLSTGTVFGLGPGKSAPNRANALRNMIEAAGDLIARGKTAEAIDQLRDIRAKCDGVLNPPDFVSGTARAELAKRVTDLIVRLGGAP
jgi:hypothetical protein